MNGRPQDPERLPAGPAPVAEPDPLEVLLSRLRGEVGRSVDGASLRHWVAAAADAAGASGRPGWGRRRAGVPMIWKRRLATALVSLVVVVGGMSGLAWAADGSAPGEALYGLDRVLEHVGIGNGGAVERLAEIRALIESGDIPAGLTYTGELVGDQAGDTSNAAEALEAAAARVAEVGSEVSADVHDHVAALLTYLAENVGQVDGQEVATLARQIGGNDGSPGSGPPEGVPPADPPGPPDDVPVGPPDGVPPGPPDNVPPSHPGGPPVSIPPVEVGPPVEPGPPISLPAQVP